GAPSECFASGIQFSRGAIGKTVETTIAQYLMRGPQLFPSVHPTVRSTQHLAVQQSASANHYGNTLPFETLDREVIELLSSDRLTYLSFRHRCDRKRPIATDGPREAFEHLKGRQGQLLLTGVYCSLHQFEQRAHGMIQLTCIGEFPSRGCKCLRITAESVVQDGLGKVGGTERVSFASRHAISPQSPGARQHFLL